MIDSEQREMEGVVALDECDFIAFDDYVELTSHSQPLAQHFLSTSTLQRSAAQSIADARGHGQNPDANGELLDDLQDIVEQNRLTAVFQPIIQMHSGEVIGYEGLIRGPQNTPLHSPATLFAVARAHNLGVQLEHLCRRVVLERFVELRLPGKLFLNISPESLVQRAEKNGETQAYIRQIRLDPNRVIIELTESEPACDYTLLRQAVLYYRSLGFEIAIDDLGEGFSSLRLWSELRPEYVKIDMHFVQGIQADPIKRQFVQSIQEIAEKSGTLVIAEGIETKVELMAVRDLGVAYGQGFHISRPMPEPPTEIEAGLLAAPCASELAERLLNAPTDSMVMTALKLLRIVPVVTPQMNNNQVFEVFACYPNLQIVPVVDNGAPVGLINRHRMIECFAQPYQRELYGRRSCTRFMDAKPLIVDKNTSLPDLSRMMAQADAHHLFNGFVITGEGRYLGMGTGHDLMREITQMQILAARYANPLTQLPGNVPINGQIDQLLQQQVPFCACYCDLDHFKPFNDVHGYRKGDDAIRLTARILSENCDSECDFIGHIGGDDFMILFRSQDWEFRCNRILNRFAAAIQDYYTETERERGGYLGEDRQGRKIFHPLISLSLGITRVLPGQYHSHHQIAEAAAEAKKQAKKIFGNSLFVERRATAQSQVE
ncbi:MAG: hypothetical protein H6R04_1895 [Burkholderiaceae bacterium]|nr:hypothetical protein [Burkholderiaceae bacterium]